MTASGGWEPHPARRFMYKVTGLLSSPIFKAKMKFAHRTSFIYRAIRAPLFENSRKFQHKPRIFKVLAAQLLRLAPLRIVPPLAIRGANETMMFAVLGGVHGRFDALKIALERVNFDGIHTVFCTGNLAGDTCDAPAALDLLRARGVRAVQGLTDRLVVRALRKADAIAKRMGEEYRAQLERIHTRLSSEHIEFLRSLPRQLNVDIEGVRVIVVHGTVTSQHDFLGEHDSLDRFRRQREAAMADIVVCGADGDGFMRWVDQSLFVNPGDLQRSDGTIRFTIIDTDADPWVARWVDCSA